MRGTFDDCAAVTQDSEVPPLPSTTPTLLQLDNCMDTCNLCGEEMQVVQEGVKVLSAEIGAYTGALVTEDGELYAFGFGRSGRHGFGIRDVAVPTRVRGGLEKERVILVGSGNTFAAVLTASGRVWTFGAAVAGSWEQVICGRGPCLPSFWEDA